MNPLLHRSSGGEPVSVGGCEVITLTTVAEHFGVWPAAISCIERGTRRDDFLAWRAGRRSETSGTMTGVVR